MLKLLPSEILNQYDLLKRTCKDLLSEIKENLLFKPKVPIVVKDVIKERNNIRISYLVEKYPEAYAEFKVPESIFTDQTKYDEFIEYCKRQSKITKELESDPEYETYKKLKSKFYPLEEWKKRY